MAIFIDEQSHVIVAASLNHQDIIAINNMKHLGTNIVGIVTQNISAAQTLSLPVFSSMTESIQHTHANTVCLLNDGKEVKTPACQAIDAGVQTIIISSHKMPLKDSQFLIHYAQSKQVHIIGPGSFGVVSPGKSTVGLLPSFVCIPGDLGIISRTGTLTIDILHTLTQQGIGQSTCICIGSGDNIGTTILEALKAFEQDPRTHAILLIDEPGGPPLNETADSILREIRKPVYAYITGRTMPERKHRGLAPVMLGRKQALAQAKSESLETAGVKILRFPYQFKEVIQPVRT